MKIGLFCNDKDEISKLELFTINKILENKEQIIQIKKPCNCGFDIVTNKNQYIIRIATENSKGCKLNEVYTYNIKNKRMLDILYCTLVPLEGENDLLWRFNSIKDSELKCIKII